MWSFNYPNLFRNIMVDNSRIDKKRTPPKDLIDIKKGIFTVPKKAGGKLHPLKKKRSAPSTLEFVAFGAKMNSTNLQYFHSVIRSLKFD